MTELHEEEVRRVCELIERLIKISGRSNRSVEQELGMGSAGLSKILGGSVRLTYVNLLRILDALGIEPAQFFRQAYPRVGGAPSPALESLRTATGESEQELAEELRNFDERVRQTMLRLLGQASVP